MASETQIAETRAFKRCALCGKEFELNPARWWRLFCSDKCKKENHYRDLAEARRIRRERREMQPKEEIVHTQEAESKDDEN